MLGAGTHIRRAAVMLAAVMMALLVCGAAVYAGGRLGDTYTIRPLTSAGASLVLDTASSAWGEGVYSSEPSGDYLLARVHYCLGVWDRTANIYYAYDKGTSSDTVAVRKKFIETVPNHLLASPEVQYVTMKDMASDVSYNIYRNRAELEDQVSSSRAVMDDKPDGLIAMDSYAQDPDYADMSASDTDETETTGGGAVADFIWKVLKSVISLLLLKMVMGVIYLCAAVADITIWFMTNMFFVYFSPDPENFIDLISSPAFDPRAVLQALGYSLFAIIFIYEMLMYLTGPVFRREEGLLGVMGRAMGAVFLTAACYPLLDEFSKMAMSIWQVFADNRSEVLPAVPVFITMTTWGSVSAADVASIAPVVIYLILIVMVVIDMFKLFLECVERWILLGVTYAFAPLAMPALAGSATLNIFKSYMKMFFTELIMVSLNLWFIYAINLMLSSGYDSTHGLVETALGTLTGSGGLEEAIENGQTYNYVVYMAMVDGLIKVAQRIDQYLNDVGLSVARTGGRLGNSVVMAGAAVAGAAARQATKGGAGMVGRNRAAQAAQGAAALRGISKEELRKGQDFLSSVSAGGGGSKARFAGVAGMALDALAGKDERRAAEAYADAVNNYSPAAARAAYDSGIDSKGRPMAGVSEVSGLPVENALRGMRNSHTGQALVPEGARVTATHDLRSGRIGFSLERLGPDGSPTGKAASGSIYPDASHGGTRFTGADGHDYWAVPNKGSDPVYGTLGEVMGGVGGRVDASGAYDMSGGSYAFSAGGLSEATGGTVMGAEAPEGAAGGTGAPLAGQAFLEPCADGSTAVYGSADGQVPLASLSSDIRDFGAIPEGAPGVVSMEDGLGDVFAVRSGMREGQSGSSFMEELFGGPGVKELAGSGAGGYVMENPLTYAQDGYAMLYKRPAAGSGAAGADGLLAYNVASGFKVEKGDTLVQMNGGLVGVRRVNERGSADRDKAESGFILAARRAAEKRRR